MPSEPRGRIVVPPLAPEAAAAVVGPPRLPANAAASLALARRAAASAIPVRLDVPAGAGRLLLARALHALAGRGGPLVAAVGRRPPLEDLPRDATLYLDAAGLAPEAALVVETLIDEGAVWVLGAVEPGGSLPVPLATRLGAVMIEVPPLAARLGELLALADDALARLAARAGMAPPALAPAALERLASHRWPGDLAELDAVLARALLAAEGDRIEADHILMPPSSAPDAAPVGVAAAPAPGGELEFLLAELAHELRNPMVTIKTYAQHLPDLLEDPALRDRFATLTDDAIDRMEALLDNVLAFARLGVPRPEPIPVSELLERVLAEVGPELAGHAIQLRHAAAPAARCAADPQHLAYALRNLFAGVVREVPAREELALESSSNGVVTLRFTAGAEAADRLRRLAAPGDAATLADPTLLPLAFRLARAVLERNGGALAVVAEGSGATNVMIRLPTAPTEEAA